ncbi:hypothetical protein OEA41_009303 [Lepraria neglecta]|uniref:Heterokaryon incompatibility domain-containing protein n=1 Tax=Lepraria neglecta TaxID=209136 RepID=A0AAD9Z1D9_9LECA|nr:hypothetical protein OEA41_009303 [Lepraria neglecta]
MPPSSWYPIYELLTRYGIDHNVAKSAAINDMRRWELDEIKTILEKVQRPSYDYCYFRTPNVTISTEAIDFKKWWPSLWEDRRPKWISPPREMMESSVREEAALCVNHEGQWTLRQSGYMALSHVWIEGLQRNNIHDGLEKQKFDAIFALLKSRKIDAEWVWADVLAIPAGGGPTTAPEDEMLTIDIINTLPQIYSRADAVLIIDALVLQLHETDPIDVVVALMCGKWATRVWTFQESKLASRALVVTAKSIYEYGDLVSLIKSKADEDPDKYRTLYLRLGTLQKNDTLGLSIPDIMVACGTRQSGQDVDYARAFFPVLGLKWEYGMTREQGMQKIYYSQRRHATRIVAFYGAPRMSIRPCWAPSYFHNLEGVIIEPMAWENRGIRGQFYAVKVAKVSKTYRHSGKYVFDLETECAGDREMQCTLAPNEDESVAEAFETVIENGRGYVLSPTSSETSLHGEWARSALLVEEQIVNKWDGFEVVVHCAANIMSRSQHSESQRSVLIRHDGPADGGLAG